MKFENEDHKRNNGWDYHAGIWDRDQGSSQVQNWKQANKQNWNRQKKKIKMLMMMMMMIKVGNQTRDNYLNNVTLLVTLLIASGNEDLSRT